MFWKLTQIINTTQRVEEPDARAHVAFDATCAILISVLIILRFAWLSESPPGFFRDEAATAAQVWCFALTGQDWDGISWPIYSVIHPDYGALIFPPVLYGGSIWVDLFGASVSSLRALTAFHGVLAIAGVGIFAGLLGGRTLGLITALIFAADPWGFLSSRIAWESSFAPAYIAWGLVFYWLAVENWKVPQSSSASFLLATPSEKLRTIVFCAAAGIFLSLACYSYPPIRIQIPIIWAGLFLPSLLNRRWPEYIITSLFMAAWLSPLLIGTLTGELQARFQMESIFNEANLRAAGLSGLPGSMYLFVSNFLQHFNWTYLAISGDENLRHSTQWQGQWSWTELIALPLGALLIQKLVQESRRRSLRGADQDPQSAFTTSKGTSLEDQSIRWLPFVVLGLIAGIIPAALTATGIPHALRSLGSQPFVAIMAGLIWFNVIIRLKTGSWLLLSVVVLSSILFLHDFFGDYPERAARYFDAPQHELLLSRAYGGTQSNLREQIANFDPHYPKWSTRYYEMIADPSVCTRQ